MVILDEIGMLPFKTIVKYGDDHAFTSEATFPGLLDAHGVENLLLRVLRKQEQIESIFEEVSRKENATLYLQYTRALTTWGH